MDNYLPASIAAMPAEIMTMILSNIHPLSADWSAILRTSKDFYEMGSDIRSQIPIPPKDIVAAGPKTVELFLSAGIHITRFANYAIDLSPPHFTELIKFIAVGENEFAELITHRPELALAAWVGPPPAESCQCCGDAEMTCREISLYLSVRNINRWSAEYADEYNPYDTVEDRFHMTIPIDHSLIDGYFRSIEPATANRYVGSKWNKFARDHPGITRCILFNCVSRGEITIFTEVLIRAAIVGAACNNVLSPAFINLLVNWAVVLASQPHLDTIAAVSYLDDIGQLSARAKIFPRYCADIDGGWAGQHDRVMAVNIARSATGEYDNDWASRQSMYLAMLSGPSPAAIADVRRMLPSATARSNVRCANLLTTPNSSQMNRNW
ncbi:MAG: hypothetical protein WDA28_13295 [Castellaniella sp.]